MNRKIILYLFIYTIIILSVKCKQKEALKSKNSLSSLPYFRRKVEEIDNTDFFETTEAEDSYNLVAFLVDNVKEIFDDIEDNSTEAIHTGDISVKLLPDKKVVPIISNSSTMPSNSVTAIVISPKLDHLNVEDIMSSSSISTSTHTNKLMLNETLLLTTLLDEKHASTENNEMNTSNNIMPREKDLKLNVRTDKKARDVTITPALGNTTDATEEMSDPRRSCIMCNNVLTEDCSDPKNKLITSVMCERDDDMCYSLHTPFGIVDRGCFNVNHNLTTYICSCNLCNYISISEMPFMFETKRDWVDNVIELSRTKHFRKSVFKDMSCLKCEVNTTTRSGDMIKSANCLEGNIGMLPMEDCGVDEICAVKALRADGYIWRGCVKAPLYNYWWAVCDGDLCNYDPLIFVHNFII